MEAERRHRMFRGVQRVGKGYRVLASFSRLLARDSISNYDGSPLLYRTWIKRVQLRFIIHQFVRDWPPGNSSVELLPKNIRVHILNV